MAEYDPLVLLNRSSRPARSSNAVFASVRRDFRMEFLYDGMAIAMRMLAITMTTMSSTKVNPRGMVIPRESARPGVHLLSMFGFLSLPQLRPGDSVDLHVGR